MNTYTVFRATETFLRAKSKNKALHELNSRRTFSLYATQHEQINDTISAINEMLSAGYLVPAATVQADTHNALFALTNSIDAPWTDNPGVTIIPNSDAYLTSSSVGDIFSDQHGNMFLVLPFGFAQLAVKQTSPLTLSAVS